MPDQLALADLIERGELDRHLRRMRRRYRARRDALVAAVATHLPGATRRRDRGRAARGRAPPAGARRAGDGARGGRAGRRARRPRQASAAAASAGPPVARARLRQPSGAGDRPRDRRAGGSAPLTVRDRRAGQDDSLIARGIAEPAGATRRSRAGSPNPTAAIRRSPRKPGFVTRRLRAGPRGSARRRGCASRAPRAGGSSRG